MVDVSRLRLNDLGGEVENVHTPLKYYCRRDPPRYSVSLFRVVSGGPFLCIAPVITSEPHLGDSTWRALRSLMLEPLPRQFRGILVPQRC